MLLVVLVLIALCSTATTLASGVPQECRTEANELMTDASEGTSAIPSGAQVSTSRESQDRRRRASLQAAESRATKLACAKKMIRAKVFYLNGCKFDTCQRGTTAKEQASFITAHREAKRQLHLQYPQGYSEEMMRDGFMTLIARSMNFTLADYMEAVHTCRNQPITRPLARWDQISNPTASQALVGIDHEDVNLNLALTSSNHQDQNADISSQGHLQYSNLSQQHYDIDEEEEFGDDDTYKVGC